METQALPKRKSPGLPRMLTRYRGVVFNLCLAAIIPLLQPLLLRRLFVGIDRNRTDTGLGLVLILLQLVELAALRWKLPAVERRLHAGSEQMRVRTPVLILWFFHLGVSTALLYPILKSFGLNPNQADDTFKGGVFLLLAAVIVIKELFVLLAVNPRRSGGAKAQIWPHREHIADALLLVYTAVSYMLLLDVAGVRGFLVRADVASLAVNLIIVAIFGLLALLPLRLAYMIEEWETLRTPLSMLVLIASILVVILVTVTSMV